MCPVYQTGVTTPLTWPGENEPGTAPDRDLVLAYRAPTTRTCSAVTSSERVAARIRARSSDSRKRSWVAQAGSVTATTRVP